MSFPYDWDFIQDNISPEKVAELRRKFMEEWRSGNYTKEEMIERYRMSERTFRETIKKYANAKELDDYKDKSRAPKNPHRKFSDEEYKEVVGTFDRTRKDVDARFSDFVENMHTDGRNLSPPKLKAQKKNLNQVWVGNLEDFKTLPEIIKLHYNEYRPHQSFDNKTPMDVRIEATKNKLVRSHQRKMNK